MKVLHILIALMLIAAVSTSHAQVGLLDSDTEVQAPIRKGEKPVIPLDTKDPTYNVWQTHLASMNHTDRRSRTQQSATGTTNRAWEEFPTS